MTMDDDVFDSLWKLSCGIALLGVVLYAIGWLLNNTSLEHYSYYFFVPMVLCIGAIIIILVAIVAYEILKSILMEAFVTPVKTLYNYCKGYKDRKEIKKGFEEEFQDAD